ncbi:MAG: c-type cytochrome [Thiolinea sp.]
MLLGAGQAMAELDGAKLYMDKTCASCHGPGGSKPIMDTYPKLAGQSAKYLVAVLKEYKAGNRTGAQAAVMSPMAAMLSDEEMEAVAAYLEGSADCEAPAAAEGENKTE